MIWKHCLYDRWCWTGRTRTTVCVRHSVRYFLPHVTIQWSRQFTKVSAVLCVCHILTTVHGRHTAIMTDSGVIYGGESGSSMGAWGGKCPQVFALPPSRPLPKKYRFVRMWNVHDRIFREFSHKHFICGRNHVLSKIRNEFLKTQTFAMLKASLSNSFLNLDYYSLF